MKQKLKDNIINYLELKSESPYKRNAIKHIVFETVLGQNHLHFTFVFYKI